jgi:hypothetical protein
LQPLDSSLSASVDILVDNFKKGSLTVGFTRGFVQSQAFVRHFGRDARIRPEGHELLFDTSQVSGTNAVGEKFTFEQQYEWLGFTARKLILDLLDEVIGDDTLSIDVFAYDLNEPDICKKLLALGKTRRIRIILDNASLHHSKQEPTPEDDFESRFLKTPSKDKIMRGVGRYATTRCSLCPTTTAPKVLTGSTNRRDRLYVNSNTFLLMTHRGEPTPASFRILGCRQSRGIRGNQWAVSEFLQHCHPIRSSPSRRTSSVCPQNQTARCRGQREGGTPKHPASCSQS